MYRKEVNERSPMRVFEKSMHGGLGRGNVGLVAALAGAGKTPVLVHIALDDLLRDRRVLHISHEHAVDHVRSFYDEIFHDLSVTSDLDAPEAVKLDVERKRLLFSLMTKETNERMSLRGGHSSIEKILQTVDFARDVAHFEPDVIIIDGFDFVHATDEAVKELAELARARNVELWFSGVVDEKPEAGRLPAPLPKFAPHVNVIVYLQPEGAAVRLRLLKDHDNPDVADLHLTLDPHTMRVIDEDMGPLPVRPRDPRKFRLVSGGANGAEAEFGACAEKWGVRETHYSFQGHERLARKRGVVVLDEHELHKGDFSLTYVSKKLHRPLANVQRQVLQTIWHQITNANQVFAVGWIQDDNTVKGGTGWGVELGRRWKKPVFVFDQAKRAWFRWSGTAWEIAHQPTITSESFAGLGTKDLDDAGRAAIVELFKRSFGEAK